jgi:hypothetical protein
MDLAGHYCVRIIVQSFDILVPKTKKPLQTHTAMSFFVAFTTPETIPFLVDCC